MRRFLRGTILCMGLLCAGCSGENKTPEEIKYQRAEEFLSNANYEDAATLFQELGTYNDSTIRYRDALIELGKKAYQNEDYKKTIEFLKDIPSERATVSVSYFKLGNQMFDEGSYDEAVSYYEQSEEEEAAEKIEECNYQNAIQEYEAGNYKEAKELFEAIDPYEDSGEYISDCNRKVKQSEEYFTIKYVVNQSAKEDSGEFYQNGKGTLSFVSMEPLDDWVGFGGRYVTYCEPESAIHFKLINNGEETLENPKVKFEFSDVILQDVSKPFVGENHAQGLGGFGTAVLKCDSNLQAGTSSEDYMLYLSQAYFNNGKTGTLKITLSADNYPAKTYSVPLKLKEDY